MYKRLLTFVLLLLLLALPLTAAGQDMVSGPGEFPIVEEPITLEILMLGHAIVEEFPTNTFTQWYSERTGINLDFDIAPPNEDREVLNLTIASGDLPDVIVGFTVDPSTLALFGPQGLFLPLSGLIEEHGHFINEVFEGSPQVRPLITSPDGEIYGLPQVNECYHCFYAQRAWINQDWLDNVGMSVPQTTDEFIEVLTAFKEQDANGNGDPNDEIPLAGAATGWNTNIDGFLMNPFVATEFKGNNQFFDMNGGVISQTCHQRRLPRRSCAICICSSQRGSSAKRVSRSRPIRLKQQVEGGDTLDDWCCACRRRIRYSPISAATAGCAMSRFRRWKVPMGVRQAPFNPWGVGSGQCVINSPRPSILRPPSNGVTACMIAKPPCVRSSAFRSGKQKRPEKQGSGAGRKRANLRSVPNLNPSGVASPPSARCKTCIGRSAVRVIVPTTCAWARFGEMMLGAWKSCFMRQTKANYEPYARDIADVIPPLAFTTAQAAEVTELRLGINDLRGTADGGIRPGSAGS